MITDDESLEIVSELLIREQSIMVLIVLKKFEVAFDVFFFHVHTAKRAVAPFVLTLLLCISYHLSRLCGHVVNKLHAGPAHEPRASFAVPTATSSLVDAALLPLEGPVPLTGGYCEEGGVRLRGQTGKEMMQLHLCLEERDFLPAASLQFHVFLLIVSQCRKTGMRMLLCQLLC